MWFQLFIFVAVAALSLVLRPKTPEVNNPAVGQLDAPTAEEGKPIPVVFGTVVVTNPNVVWYGDISYSEVRTKGGK